MDPERGVLCLEVKTLSTINQNRKVRAVVGPETPSSQDFVSKIDIGSFQHLEDGCVPFRMLHSVGKHTHVILPKFIISSTSLGPELDIAEPQNSARTKHDHTAELVPIPCIALCASRTR